MHWFKKVFGPFKQKSTPMLKLNTDCCDEIFEFLSLEDLHSLSQTSRTMRTVTGEYFRRNYKSICKFFFKLNLNKY